MLIVRLRDDLSGDSSSPARDYGVEVSPGLISTVTDGVVDEVRSWHSRPPDAVYPILYLGARQVKVKDQGRVSNKAIHLAIGINLRGTKFWLSIITELKNRGVKDIFIACVDGLKGLLEAIGTVYPRTQVRLCLAHLMRFSLACVTCKDRKSAAADLKVIYRAATAEEAKRHLSALGQVPDLHSAKPTQELVYIPVIGVCGPSRAR